MNNLPKLQEKLALEFQRAHAFTATRWHMRNANKDDHRERDPDDDGPLRIVSARLANSLWPLKDKLRFPDRKFPPEGSDGVDERWAEWGGNASHKREKGATVGNSMALYLDLSYGTSTYYASLHEEGGINEDGAEVPARPYWEPALNNVTMTRYAKKAVTLFSKNWAIVLNPVKVTT